MSYHLRSATLVWLSRIGLRARFRFAYHQVAVWAGFLIPPAQWLTFGATLRKPSGCPFRRDIQDCRTGLASRSWCPPQVRAGWPAGQAGAEPAVSGCRAYPANGNYIFRAAAASPSRGRPFADSHDARPSAAAPRASPRHRCVGCRSEPAPATGGRWSARQLRGWRRVGRLGPQGPAQVVQPQPVMPGALSTAALRPIMFAERTLAVRVKT